MFSVGLWTQDEGLVSAIVRGAAGAPVAFCDHDPLDLLVIGPDLPQSSGGVGCPIVLLPGTAGPLARRLHSGCTVSYGPSPKDTLTFSSLEGRQICLAIQRELITLAGAVVDQQEVILSLPTDCSPQSFLATAGALLIIGIPPEELARRLDLV